MKNEFCSSRKDFILSASTALAGLSLPVLASERDVFSTRQREIDRVTPADFKSYLQIGHERPQSDLAAELAKFPTFGRLEAAFTQVLREVKETRVTNPNRPAIWYVYNMGLIVKTTQSLFAIDLHHRRSAELAPFLNFALITHAHGDHNMARFRTAMDAQEHKTIVNNFFDNAGARARGRESGFTRTAKTFRFGDVIVRASPVDHNARLINYTLAYEISIGTFTLFHSGDCSSHRKFNLHDSAPDLWVFHPYCGMNPVYGARNLKPKRCVIAHLQELGHAKNRWRWTYRKGEAMKVRLQRAGFETVMPFWGERLV